MEIVSNVDVIQGNKTSIIKFFQSSDNGYKGFGEVYFSVVPYGVERNWKIHTRATCNIMVPYGRVLFMIAEYDLSRWSFIELGNEPQKRLTIPPMSWYGFLGVGDNESMVANVIDIRHRDEQLDAAQEKLWLEVPKAEVSWKERTIKYPDSWK